MSTEVEPDVYVTVTPYGRVLALFDDGTGVRLEGPDDAVAAVRRAIDAATNGVGMSMTLDNIEPADYFAFCQPKGSGIMIHEPADVVIGSAVMAMEPEDEAAPVMDAASSPIMIRVMSRGQQIGTMTPEEFRNAARAPRSMFLEDVIKQFNAWKQEQGEPERVESFLFKADTKRGGRVRLDDADPAAVLDGVAGAITSLEVTLNVLETNEPINRAAGKDDQADLEAANAADVREALEVLREHEGATADRLDGVESLPALRAQLAAATTAREKLELAKAIRAAREEPPEPAGLTPEEQSAIATTIWRQLGGNKFKVMTGAKDAVALGEASGAPLGGLRFSLPTGFSQKDGKSTGINRVTIRVNASDTYDIEFGGARGRAYTVRATAEDIYADNLREVFTRYTGLDTRLGTGGPDGVGRDEARAEQMGRSWAERGNTAVPAFDADFTALLNGITSERARDVAFEAWNRGWKAGRSSAPVPDADPQKVAGQAALAALAAHGWKPDSYGTGPNVPLDYMSLEVGGGYAGGMVNTKGVRRVMASVKGPMLVAKHGIDHATGGDKTVASVLVGIGQPEAAAKDLHEAVMRWASLSNAERSKVEGAIRNTQELLDAELKYSEDLRKPMRIQHYTEHLAYLRDVLDGKAKIGEAPAMTDAMRADWDTTQAVIDERARQAAAAPVERFRYALVNRPADFATLPKGLRYEVEPRPAPGQPHHAMARHGILVADRELTVDELRAFELAPLVDGPMLDVLAAKIAESMAEYAAAYLKQANEEPQNFQSRVLDIANSPDSGVRYSIGTPGALIDRVEVLLQDMVNAAPAPQPPAEPDIPPTPPLGTDTPMPGPDASNRPVYVAMLEQIAAGTHPAMLDPELADQIEDAIKRFPDDAEVQALADRAVVAYSNGLMAATG